MYPEECNSQIVPVKADGRLCRRTRYLLWFLRNVPALSQPDAARAEQLPPAHAAQACFSGEKEKDTVLRHEEIPAANCSRDGKTQDVPSMT